MLREPGDVQAVIRADRERRRLVIRVERRVVPAEPGLVPDLVVLDEQEVPADAEVGNRAPGGDDAAGRVTRKAPGTVLALERRAIASGPEGLALRAHAQRSEVEVGSVAEAVPGNPAVARAVGDQPGKLILAVGGSVIAGGPDHARCGQKLCRS